ncbi:MAG: hypothetical protein NTW08_09105 [Gammaproteobacteria bacterium]|nr:hypothetical protein [Gammaproteobacteria bacterium]
MSTKSELTSLETVINRLIRYVKRSDKYKDNRALITALTPSEEKLFIAEGKTLAHLFDDYLAKHLSMTEIEMKTLCKDFMRSSGGTLEPLSLEVMGVVADYLPAKDEGRLSASSTRHHGLFARTANVRHLLTCVVQADLDGLKVLVAKNPGSIFEKARHITTPAGDTYHKLSTFQAMTFICDADMKRQIMGMVMPYMTEEMGRIRQIQYAEIDSGGADLVKLDRDPTTLPFSEIKSWIDRTTLPETPLSIPLLENKDGLIFYDDGLYYANQALLQVTQLNVDEEALAQLKPLFTHMIDNSARRSSDKDHQLIEKLLKHPETNKPLTLSRKGIRYVHEDVSYHDHRIEFRLPTVYRRYFPLITQGSADHNWDPVEQFWLNEINGAQKEVLWLLQRFCEPNRPFYPPPDFNASPFVRGFEIHNWSSWQFELVFSGGRFSGDFESSLVSIYKATGARRAGARGAAGPEFSGVRLDFAASLRLIEDGKANVVELNDRALLRPGAPGATL